jgi:hypothetical protein
MTFLVESPWTILLTGIIIEAVLGLLLLQTGRGKILVAMIVVGAVTLAGLVVERLIITDRKAVEMTLDKAVAAVEAGNIDRLLECISPSAKETREDARWNLKNYKVNSVWIRNLDIKINNLTSPPTAVAKFTVIGNGDDANHEALHNTIPPLDLTVDFQKENGRWVVAGYAGDPKYLPHRR